MTLWQDQPPQTRRQAREMERLKAPGSTTPEAAPDEPVEAPQTTSRRAATVEPTPGGEIPVVTTPFVFTSGRGDATAAPAEPTPFADAGTPPARPNLPTYGASFDAILASQPEQEAPAQSEAPAALYRETPPADAVEPVTTPVALVPESELPQVPLVTVPHDDSDESVPERTLTRRELRAMLQAQEANQFAGGRADAPVETEAPVAFTPAPFTEPAAPLAPEDPLRALFAAAPVEEEAPEVAEAPEAPANSPSAWPFAPVTPSPAAEEAEPAREEPVEEVPAPSMMFGLPVSPQAEPEPQAPVAPSFVPAPPVFPASSATGQVEPAAAESTDDESTADEARQPYQPPVGHWSTAAELDDKNQPFDQIISRSVGSSGSATTTSALILPVIPSAPDATGPLTSTGEILVTGSIDLPRGLGSTGQHPDRYDTSDMDRMFEADENEFNTSDVAPIRASRAVSTHTSTRGVITPPKKRGGRLPVVLSITAAILAIGVVGLLVAGYILKVF